MAGDGTCAGWPRPWLRRSAAGRLHTRAQARAPHPQSPGPRARRLGRASGRSRRHTPAPRLGPNGARRPAPVPPWAGSRPPARRPYPRYRPSQAGCSREPGATPPVRVDRAPTSPRARPGVAGLGAGRGWEVSGKKLDGPRDPRSCASAAGRGRTPPASALCALPGTPPSPGSAGDVGKAQPASCPAPFIHPSRSSGKPSFSSSRKRAPTN